MNSLPTLSADSMKAHTAARVRMALDRIQRAQNELNAACADLSAICGAIPQWKATARMADQVRALWYRIDALRWRVVQQKRVRLKLDDANLQEILRQQQQAERQS